MFWSGNYNVVRELNSLLKEENVSLTQILEADDILQECKADNKALLQFLTKPENLSDLITLIMEEPPNTVDLTSQYRHASIACEVLTSRLSMLSDRLSMDTVQMHRLCDFVSKPPPLNPLLASYFSKTVEMLLERSPKQDCYLYHIVCLRVVDFFKSRPDFLPNLLRHISTSAIADTFKYFIRLDDLFNKSIMEWFETHQFLDCLIQIICGIYHIIYEQEYQELDCEQAPDNSQQLTDQPEKGQQEESEKAEVNHKDVQEDCPIVNSKDRVGNDIDTETDPCNNNDNGNTSVNIDKEKKATKDLTNVADLMKGIDPKVKEERMRAVSSANAAGLLCDLILNGCAEEGNTTRSRTSCNLLAMLRSERMVRSLLQGMFTSPTAARKHAIVNGCQVLLALLSVEPIIGGDGEWKRTSVELALAPHLPLLHQALLQDPNQCTHDSDTPPNEAQPPPDGGGSNNVANCPPPVGAARIHVAAFLAQLAASEVKEVPTTMLTLGTPGVLVDMFFKYPHNNFLHAQVYSMVDSALNNKQYSTQYAKHLLVECDLLTRLMDAFEENESKKGSGYVRAAYMGYVVAMLRRVSRASEDLLARALLPDPVLNRWHAFLQEPLAETLRQHDTLLGGYYPSECTYEVENMGEVLETSYEFNEASVSSGAAAEAREDAGADHLSQMSALGEGMPAPDFEVDMNNDLEDKMDTARRAFLELIKQRYTDDCSMWDEAEPAADGDEPALQSGPTVHEVLEQASPWEAASADSNAVDEGWAQFNADTFGGDNFGSNDFPPFWTYSESQGGTDTSSQGQLEQSMANLRLEGDPHKPLDEASTVSLATNLLTAMSSMAPDVVADIVNSNLAPPPIPPLHDVTSATAATDTDGRQETDNSER